VIRNIDGRVQAQAAVAAVAAALTQPERQFATLVENSPDVLARVDRDLCYPYVSPVVERDSGVPALAHIGRDSAQTSMPPKFTPSGRARCARSSPAANWGRSSTGSTASTARPGCCLRA